MKLPLTVVVAWASMYSQLPAWKGQVWLSTNHQSMTSGGRGGPRSDRCIGPAGWPPISALPLLTTCDGRRRRCGSFRAATLLAGQAEPLPLRPHGPGVRACVHPCAAVSSSSSRHPSQRFPVSYSTGHNMLMMSPTSCGDTSSTCKQTQRAQAVLLQLSVRWRGCAGRHTSWWDRTGYTCSPLPAASRRPRKTPWLAEHCRRRRRRRSVQCTGTPAAAGLCDGHTPSDLSCGGPAAAAAGCGDLSAWARYRTACKAFPPAPAAAAESQAPLPTRARATPLPTPGSATPLPTSTTHGSHPAGRVWERGRPQTLWLGLRRTVLLVHS